MKYIKLPIVLLLWVAPGLNFTRRSENMGTIFEGNIKNYFFTILFTIFNRVIFGLGERDKVNDHKL